MTSWLVKAFEDALQSSLDCCGSNKRNKEQSLVQAPAPVQPFQPPQSTSCPRPRHKMPRHVFPTLRKLLTRDNILSREVLERTSKTTMTMFLQQCIKGREDLCEQLWGSLRENARKELLDICVHSHKAHIFFTKIAEPDDHELPEPASEAGSSASTTSWVSSPWSNIGGESTE